MTYAAFAVVILSDGRVAATTRPTGGIGLPGGKCEPGESPVSCAEREAREEGWRVTRPLAEIHRQAVDGRPVVWVLFERATKLARYKELGRVAPVEATLREALASGMGNEVAVPRALEVLSDAQLLRRLCVSRRQYVAAVRARARMQFPRGDEWDYTCVAAAMWRRLAAVMVSVGVRDIGRLGVPYGPDCPRLFFEWVEGR